MKNEGVEGSKRKGVLLLLHELTVISFHRISIGAVKERMLAGQFTAMKTITLIVMIIQHLPKPDTVIHSTGIPFFPDHFLFTEKITRAYEYPEHISSLGIITSFSGKGNFYINGDRKDITEEYFLVVNTGSRLAFQLKGKAVQPVLLFFQSQLQQVIADSISKSDEELLGNSGDQHVYDFSFLERLHLMNPALQNTLRQIIALGSSCASFHALKADILTRHLLEQLCVSNLDAARLSQRLKVVKRSTRIEIFKRLSLVKEWLQADYSRNISLQDMAAVAMMNSQHFLRLFKAVFCITPHQFLLELRLVRAKELLITGQQTVTDVCNQVGFESVSSFAGVFKRRWGVSPGKVQGLKFKVQGSAMPLD